MTTSADHVDILAAARSNDAFRREVLTGEHEQVVVMTIPPGGEIGEEVHPQTDQVLVFVDGRAVAELDDRRAKSDRVIWSLYARVPNTTSSTPARALSA